MSKVIDFISFFLFWLKVIGKALMLDEIINYVQSLQRQVEVRAQQL
jgi:hypothetical protein